MSNEMFLLSHEAKADVLGHITNSSILSIIIFSIHIYTVTVIQSLVWCILLNNEAKNSYKDILHGIFLRIGIKRVQTSCLFARYFMDRSHFLTARKLGACIFN